jgi:hypothetical protein
MQHFSSGSLRASCPPHVYSGEHRKHYASRAYNSYSHLASSLWQVLRSGSDHIRVIGSNTCCGWQINVTRANKRDTDSYPLIKCHHDSLFKPFGNNRWAGVRVTARTRTQPHYGVLLTRFNWANQQAGTAIASPPQPLRGRSWEYRLVRERVNDWNEKFRSTAKSKLPGTAVHIFGGKADIVDGTRMNLAKRFSSALRLRVAPDVSAVFQ